MKKRTLLAMVALSALLAACGKNESASTAAAPVAAPVPAAMTKLVIGLDDNFPPMGFRDDKNEIVGFDIDMAREAAKRMNVEVDFKPIDWSAKEAELVGKRVDALADQLGLLGAPVDGLEVHFHVHALGGFTRHVDVEADDLVLVVTKAHGREVVVQADHQLGHGCRHGGGNRRGGGGCGLVLAAGCQQCRQGHHGQEGAFFHGLKLWSGKSERRRPLHARCAIVVMNGSLAEPLSRLGAGAESRSEEHTSELQSQSNLVCRLLLEKKKQKNIPVLASYEYISTTDGLVFG